MSKCLNCGKELSKNQYKFCSRSCAAKVNNSKRKVSNEQKLKISKSLKNFYKGKIGDSNCTSLIKRTCLVCGRVFYHTFSKGSTKKICSDKCRDYYRTHRNEFLSSESKELISLGGRKSVNIQKETRRSKNEIYFCELCEKHFEDVEHNEPKFNGWDADVIINDIKVAVLWNGIWHYKDITKKSQLKQIQNRDIIKINEIKKCGYKPYIIKDMGSEDRLFVEKEFKKFLKYSGLEKWPISGVS